MQNKPIYVTQPHLPPLEELIPYLEKIWKSRILTNGGPLHTEFEAQLCNHLGVNHLSLVTNATIGLVTALQTLRISGEVITTPYSFVATANSLVWNGIKPVFVDIEPDTLNIDPLKIEAAITKETTAILAVHCYGTPCNVERIQRIADDYNLRVIYDSAHAFGVEKDCKSILNWGDLSVLSFHATKVFNTFEGGAIICRDDTTKRRVDRLKNFGITDEVTVVAPGINGKMSELNAAIGILQLLHVKRAIEKRGEISDRYTAKLKSVPGVRLLQATQSFKPNHSYFPILIEEGYPISRDELYLKLKDCGIFTRRYFYPLITEFPTYRDARGANPANLPIASYVADRVLCLPIYPDLEVSDQDRVISAIVRFACL